MQSLTVTLTSLTSAEHGRMDHWPNPAGHTVADTSTSYSRHRKGQLKNFAEILKNKEQDGL